MYKTLLILGATTIAAAAVAQTAGVPHTVHTKMEVFHDTNFNGEDMTVETPSSTVHADWPIRSIAVHPGDRWQICGRSRFRDPCIVLDRNAADARQIGIDDQIGSARLVDASGNPASPR